MAISILGFWINEPCFPFPPAAFDALWHRLQHSFASLCFSLNTPQALKSIFHRVQYIFSSLYFACEHRRLLLLPLPCNSVQNIQQRLRFPYSVISYLFSSVSSSKCTMIPHPLVDMYEEQNVILITSSGPLKLGAMRQTEPFSSSVSLSNEHMLTKFPHFFLILYQTTWFILLSI